MINQTPKIRTQNPNNRDKSNGRITAPSKPKWSSSAAVRNWEATIIVSPEERFIASRQSMLEEESRYILSQK